MLKKKKKRGWCGGHYSRELSGANHVEHVWDDVLHRTSKTSATAAAYETLVALLLATPIFTLPHSQNMPDSIVPIFGPSCVLDSYGADQPWAGPLVCLEILLEAHHTTETLHATECVPQLEIAKGPVTRVWEYCDY